MAHESNQQMQQCIEHCLRCYQTCLHEAMNHCLEAGGKHVGTEAFPTHDRLCRTVPHGCPLHAEQQRNAWTCLRRVRRGVRGLRAKLQPSRRYGRVRAVCRTCAESCHSMATALLLEVSRAMRLKRPAHRAKTLI